MTDPKNLPKVTVKFTKKQVVLAVVMAILGAVGVLFPDQAASVGQLLTSLVSSGVFE